MPNHFAILDNLQYKDDNGNTHTLDVIVRRGSLSGNNEKGQTEFNLNSVSMIIGGTANNKDQEIAHSVIVTLGPGFNRTTLPNEGGHIVSLAAAPRQYYDMLKASPGHNCQDPKNSTSLISKTAIEWQKYMENVMRNNKKNR